MELATWLSQSETMGSRLRTGSECRPVLSLLKYIDARLAEPSTWSAIAALLVALHVNVSSDLWHAVTLWGVGASGVLGFLIAESSSGNSTIQVAQDILAALVQATNKQGAKE